MEPISKILPVTLNEIRSNLKPCPCRCGGEAVILAFWDGWVVQCKENKWHHFSTGQTWEEAVMNWNSEQEKRKESS